MNSLMVLQVESTNICNAHCVFCPHDRFKQFGSMTDTLWQKIVAEASQLPHLQTFIPMLTGEPFCDKQILERVKLVSQKMPWVAITIYTNGSLLTPEILQALKAIPNVSLNISLNGLNPETRQKVTGLNDWPHVLKMIKYCEQIKLSHRISAVAYPEISEDERRGFIQAGGILIQYQSWAGQQYPYKRNRWTSCVRALNYMTVRYDGSVCLCCFDPFGKVIFGNLNNQTIEEVWKGKIHQEYMIKHREGKGNNMPLCESCTEG